MREDPKSVAYALSFAVLIGGLLQVLVHLVAIKKFNLHRILLGGWKYRKSKDVEGEKKHFKSLFLPGILGNSTPQISAFIDTLLATFLMTGSVSYLFYANRVFHLPVALIAIATATVLFPAVSKALKNGQESQAYANLDKAFWLLAFFWGLLCWVVSSWLSLSCGCSLREGSSRSYRHMRQWQYFRCIWWDSCHLGWRSSLASFCTHHTDTSKLPR